MKRFPVKSSAVRSVGVELAAGQWHKGLSRLPRRTYFLED